MLPLPAVKSSDDWGKADSIVHLWFEKFYISIMISIDDDVCVLAHNPGLFLVVEDSVAWLH